MGCAAMSLSTDSAASSLCVAGPTDRDRPRVICDILILILDEPTAAALDAESEKADSVG